MGSSPNNMFSSGMPSSLQQGSSGSAPSPMSGPGNQSSAGSLPPSPTGYGSYGGMPGGSLGWSNPAPQGPYRGFGSAGYSPTPSTFGLPQPQSNYMMGRGGLAAGSGFGSSGSSGSGSTTNNYYTPAADGANVAPPPAAAPAPAVDPNTIRQPETQSPAGDVLSQLFGALPPKREVN
jgi:hypothetical protein